MDYAAFCRLADRVVELSKAKPYRPGEERTRADGSVWRKPEDGGPLVRVRGPKRRAPKTPVQLTDDEAQTRIFDAINNIRREQRDAFGRQVTVVDLRRSLHDIPREELDRHLFRLEHAWALNLYEFDPKMYRTKHPQQDEWLKDERGHYYGMVSIRGEPMVAIRGRT